MHLMQHLSHSIKRGRVIKLTLTRDLCVHNGICPTICVNKVKVSDPFCISCWATLTLISLNLKNQVWVISPFWKKKLIKKIHRWKNYFVTYFVRIWFLLSIHLIGFAEIFPHLVLNGKKYNSPIGFNIHYFII